MNKKLVVLGSLSAVVILLVNCSKKDAVATPANLKALPLTVSTPADNPQTPQRIALGRLLFWDPVLSGNKDVACASCHHSALGFTDNIDLSIGVNGVGLGIARSFATPNAIPFTKRNSLSIINTAFNGMDANGNCNPATAAMFFDNRANSLELQSLEPIKTLEEMRGPRITTASILDTVMARLKSMPQYIQFFKDAFATDNAITIEHLGMAIASYERSIVANHSAYDAYERGDKNALTAAQVQGLTAFQDNGCARCHSGPMFSDYSLHVLSVPDNTRLPTDAGANNSYAFRTPTLRNLALTAPYMHSGVFKTLNEVMNFYDQVGDRRSQNQHVSNTQLDGNLQRLNRNDQNNIIQFLQALNDNSFDKSIPASVPSGLHPGGNL